MATRDDLEIGLCWGTLQQANLLELIEAAARHGFPTLSVRPDMVNPYLADDPSGRVLRRRLAAAGVRVRVIDALSRGLPGVPDYVEVGARRTLRADETGCLRIAEVLEAPFVNVTFFGGDLVSRDEVGEALRDVTARAVARGVRLVLEFVPGSSLADIDVAREVVRQVDDPGCTILLDSWHLARSGGTLDDVRALPERSIGALQLCDRSDPAPGAPYVPMQGRSLPGEGQLPLHELVDAALANNPDLTAEIEVFSEELRTLTVDAAAGRVAAAIAAWRTASAATSASDPAGRSTARRFTGPPGRP